jgi:putative transposase
VQRTVRLLLQPTAEQSVVLAETASEFTKAFNLCTRIGWDQGVRNATSLHYVTYKASKAFCPTLVSDLHIQARIKASEALRSAAELAKTGREVSMPQSEQCPPRYNLRTFKLNWDKSEIRLSTAQGKQTIAFSLPEYAAQFQGLPTATADLVFHHERWHLHVVTEQPAPEVNPNGEVVGVDLGLTVPAVTSANQFLGERRWKNVEKRFFRLKRSLQKRGTKHAKRRLRKIRGKQRRFRRDCDHLLSKRIVQSVGPGTTIVLENLKDIRRTTKVKRKTETSRRIHGWSFAQLKSFIEYKAEARGCTVSGVDPRHTSRQCCRCGHIARNNRRCRSVFKCRSCGFELPADLNAARSIEAKYRAGIGMPDSGGPDVNRPIAEGVEALNGVDHRIEAEPISKPPALAGGS